LKDAYVSGEIDAFVEFLHVCHQHQAKSKDDNYRFSPAMFDPDLSSENSRGKVQYRLSPARRAGYCVQLEKA